MENKFLTMTAKDRLEDFNKIPLIKSGNHQLSEEQINALIYDMEEYAHHYFLHHIKGVVADAWFDGKATERFDSGDEEEYLKSERYLKSVNELYDRKEITRESLTKRGYSEDVSSNTIIFKIRKEFCIIHHIDENLFKFVSLMEGDTFNRDIKYLDQLDSLIYSVI